MDASDNSKNTAIIAEQAEIIVENEPINSKKDEAPEEPLPKRGRPKGAKDAKPRIKRVPVEAPEEKPTVKPVEAPKAKPKPKVEIRYEEPEEPEEHEEPEEPAVEEPPPSPRALHRQRVQQAAMERRLIARERQDRFERILDNFMGF